MDTRIRKLIDVLEVNGWKVEGKIEDSLEWWADEILKIISLWNPVASKFYLATLVDPEWGTYEVDYRKRVHRKPGQGVVAIGFSKTIPKERLHDFALQYSLNELNDPKIIEQIEKLRTYST